MCLLCSLKFGNGRQFNKLLMNADLLYSGSWLCVLSLGRRAVRLSTAPSAAVDGVHVLLCVVILRLDSCGREHHLFSLSRIVLSTYSVDSR